VYVSAANDTNLSIALALLRWRCIVALRRTSATWVALNVVENIAKLLIFTIALSAWNAVFIVVDVVVIARAVCYSTIPCNIYLYWIDKSQCNAKSLPLTSSWKKLDSSPILIHEVHCGLLSYDHVYNSTILKKNCNCCSLIASSKIWNNVPI